MLNVFTYNAYNSAYLLYNKRSGDRIVRVELADLSAGKIVRARRMSMDSDYAMILTTCAERETAREIARILIEKHLVACAQMFPIESMYTWQGEVCEENEIILLIKTKATMFERVAAEIKENHPYEVPEIIQLPIADGLPDYLRWIDENID